MSLVLLILQYYDCVKLLILTETSISYFYEERHTCAMYVNVAAFPILLFFFYHARRQYVFYLNKKVPALGALCFSDHFLKTNRITSITAV